VQDGDAGEAMQLEQGSVAERPAIPAKEVASDSGIQEREAREAEYLEMCKQEQVDSELLAKAILKISKLDVLSEAGFTRLKEGWPRNVKTVIRAYEEKESKK